MSAPTINEVFGTGLIGRNYAEPAPAVEFSPLKDAASCDHFSTATWFLPNGRTARSVASAEHCESESNLSRIRRVLLNLSGRKSEAQS
jgi:hypothetical protein